MYNTDIIASIFWVIMATLISIIFFLILKTLRSFTEDVKRLFNLSDLLAKRIDGLSNYCTNMSSRNQQQFDHFILMIRDLNAPKEKTIEEKTPEESV